MTSVALGGVCGAHFPLPPSPVCGHSMSYDSHLVSTIHPPDPSHPKLNTVWSFSPLKQSQKPHHAAWHGSVEHVVRDIFVGCLVAAPIQLLRICTPWQKIN